MSAPLGETSSLLPAPGGGSRYTQPAGPSFERRLFPTYNDPFTPAALSAADKRSRRRFAFTIVLGFLLWLLLGLFVGIVGGEGAWWDAGNGARRTLEPIPTSDGNVTYCADFLKTLPTSVIVIPPGKEHLYISQDNTMQSPPAWWSSDVHGVETVNGGQTVEDKQRTGSFGSGSTFAVTQGNGVQNVHIGSGGSIQITGGGSVSIVESNSFSTQGGGDWPSGGVPSTIYKSKVYFQYDITEDDGFYILGRGLYSGGPVRYVVEEPKAPQPKTEHDVDDASAKVKIEVEVTARWNDKELLKSSKVCALSRHADTRDGHQELGLGIYTPSHNLPGPYHHLSFETIVRLPPSDLKKLHSLNIHGTNVGPVELDVESVAFEHVHFNTSNGSVHALSPLKSVQTEILTSNGAIDGTYSVSEKLSLESTNGRINARIALVKVASDAISSNINVKAHSSNGNVYVNYVEHPVGVVLDSSARTTNGEVGVIHSPAFEGFLKLSTSWGRGSVKASNKTADPSGHNRDRQLKLTIDENGLGHVRKEGSVYWGERKSNSGLGQTVVQTTNGAASLDFS